MLDIIDEIRRLVDQDKPFVLARVISTWGSAPRGVGSGMIITEDHEVAGSVSGGCIEGAVIREADQVLKNGTAKELSFGISNEDAWSVGLTCGGKISVFLEKFLAFDKEGKEIWETMDAMIRDDKSFVLITRMDNSNYRHGLYAAQKTHKGEIPSKIKSKSKNVLKTNKSLTFESEGSKYFLHIFPEKPKLLIVGAAHISLDLIRLGKMYGFETILVDPRRIFTKQSRFDVKPDLIYNEWPEIVFPNLDLGERTFAVLLTHDPKIDDQALDFLLNSNVAYIGALGSRKTHIKRVGRLREKGFADEKINKIIGPVGLDINAKEPVEIALSIMAQIIEEKNKGL